MREKREALKKALEGHVKAHHLFVLTELLCQIDSLEETIARFDQQIEEYCLPPFLKKRLSYSIRSQALPDPPLR